MRCDGSPDPTIPGEINTYINLRLEDSEHNDIDSVMKQGQQDIAVSNFDLSESGRWHREWGDSDKFLEARTAGHFMGLFESVVRL